VRYLSPAAFCLAITGVTLSGQTQGGQGRLQPLPLTQLDERALAADLDNRTFTLTFAQPVPVRDLLLLVRGTSLSIVPDPAIEGTFMGELKNVTVRQALGLICRPLVSTTGWMGRLSGSRSVSPRHACSTSPKSPVA